MYSNQTECMQSSKLSHNAMHYGNEEDAHSWKDFTWIVEGENSPEREKKEVLKEVLRSHSLISEDIHHVQCVISCQYNMVKYVGYLYTHR